MLKKDRGGGRERERERVLDHLTDANENLLKRGNTDTRDNLRLYERMARNFRQTTTHSSGVQAGADQIRLLCLQ
jgi:hypothetical protein